MYSGQKKITAFGLVLLLAMPLLFSAIFLVRLKVLQSTSHIRFVKEITQTISVPQKNVIWVKKGKEIQINGKYFDVKSMKTEGDHVLLTGHYDHKEDKLVNGIRKIFQQNKESDSPLNQTVVKFLFFPTYCNHAEISCGINCHFISTQYYSFDELLPAPPCLSFTQPPKI